VIAIAGERFGARQARSNELCSPLGSAVPPFIRAAQWLGSVLSREEASVDPNSWAFSYQVRAKSTLAN